MSDGESSANKAAAARMRAAAARERACRADQAAESQELMAARSGRELHLRTAEIHRRIAAQQRTSAELQETYARRLEMWSRRLQPPPRFMAAVAEACGAPSAALSLVGRDRTQLAVAASDDISRTAQELEFILDEGPTHDATRTRDPIVVTDASVIERRWPGCGPALTGLGLTSVVAVPLAATDVCIGALALYDPPSGTAAGPRLCAEVAETVMRTVLLGPDRDPGLYGETEHRATVHQAAGAYSVRMGCTVGDALALIKARAFADGVSTEVVAQWILANPRALP